MFYQIYIYQENIYFRMYIRDGNSVEARLLDTPLPCGWEYVGACGRLVATALTAKAQVGLAIAYQTYMAAAHQGPAGTGKTETVKVYRMFGVRFFRKIMNSRTKYLIILPVKSEIQRRFKID